MALPQSLLHCNKIVATGVLRTKRLGMADTVKHRPVYRNIHITQLPHYRLPAPGWVSILHRISGALLFILLPFTIWMFDASLTSEVSYEQFTAVFAAGAGGLPGWLWKLVAFALIWPTCCTSAPACATSGWTRPTTSASRSDAARPSSSSS